MNMNKALGLGFGIALCATAATAFAQTAPFTIRRPLDGATVREKVRVEIPRGSIKKGAFVAFFIDDKFVVAQAPEGDDSPKPRMGIMGAPPPPRKGPDPMKVPFTYVWDTKSTHTSDGEHKMRAVLFEPAPGTTGMNEAGSTEVKVTIANKIGDGPTSLQLRYKYREGESLEYARNSSAKLKGGEEAGASGTGDTELGAIRSKIILGIEDANPAEDVSLIRNKLTSLHILTNGTEVTATPDQLSESMYQEIDSRGKISYETGALTGFAEYANSGIPVDNVVGLPLLPLDPVSVGETWTQANQRLEVPGVPVALQPRVPITSKLEDLEWEAGRPSAKIRQSYEGELPEPIRVAGMLITTPVVAYEKVIYFAYKSGIILRTTRTFTIKGRSADAPMASPAGGAPSGMGGGLPPGMNTGGMPAGMLNARGGMGGAMSGMPPGMGGGRGAAGMGGGLPPGMNTGGMPAGMLNARGGQRGGMSGGGRLPGRGANGGGQRGGMSGGGGMGGSGMGGSGMSGGGMGMMQGGFSGGSAGANRRGGGIGSLTGNRNGGTGFTQQATDRAVTIEATQDTEVQSISANR